MHVSLFWAHLMAPTGSQNSCSDLQVTIATALQVSLDTFHLQLRKSFIYNSHNTATRKRKKSKKKAIQLWLVFLVHLSCLMQKCVHILTRKIQTRNL